MIQLGLSWDEQGQSAGDVIARTRLMLLRPELVKLPTVSWDENGLQPTCFKILPYVPEKIIKTNYSFLSLGEYSSSLHFISVVFRV